jgi:hypothetical protein
MMKLVGLVQKNSCSGIIALSTASRSPIGEVYLVNLQFSVPSLQSHCQRVEISQVHYKLYMIFDDQ